MNRKLNRRSLLKTSGGAVAGASMLGMPVVHGRAATAQDESLEVWTFSEQRASYIEAATKLDSWTSVHPNTEVNIRVFPSREMHDKLLTALVSGKGAPDVSSVEINSFSRFIGSDRVPFVGLNDRIGDELDNLAAAAATDPWSWDGNIYGIGNVLSTAVLAYRTDVMEEAGVTEAFDSWDTVIEAGKQVSEGDERKMFALHDLSMGDYFMLAQNAGTMPFDAEGNYVGDNDKSVAAMDLLHDMVYDHGIAGIAPATAGDSWFSPQYRAAYRANQYVATFGPPWHLAFLRLDVPEQSGKWTLQQLPAGLGDGLPTATYGGTAECITEQSEKVDLAWDLIQTISLTTESAVESFNRLGVYPTYIPAYDDPALQQPDEYFSGINTGQLYAELAPDLITYTQSPDWNEFTEALVRTVVTPVMQDQADAASALGELGGEF